jgi:glycerophosphoryl diester phosphodiesterase
VSAGRRILVHGHRGARAIYPESTLPGFVYAIEVGADALELDVAVTKDNIVVVSHDPHINPSGAAIRELTLAELRHYDRAIPTLDQVLGLAPGGAVQFDIEIKCFPDSPVLAPEPDAFAQLVLSEIRHHRLEPRVAVLSFDFRTLQAMHRLAPEIRLAALWEGEPRPFVSMAQAAQASIVSPHFSLVTLEQVQAAHQANLAVVPWTANTPAEWQPLIDAGVDGIITDDPAALITFLGGAR